MTYFASAPYAFKSRYYVEHTGWDADFKVDYDGHKNPIDFRKVRVAAAWLRKRNYVVRAVSAYRTAKGWHLRVWLEKFGANEPVPPYTALRVQRLFGDDPVRARFNERRVRRGENGWNVLFNEKHRNGKLIYREELNQALTSRFERILKS